MNFDLLRALGVTAGVVLVSMVVSVFIYAPSVPLETADVLATLISIIIIGAFSFIYFKNGPVKPSTEAGFWLGCVLFAYTFAYGFLGGYLNAMQGLPSSPLAPMSAWVMLASAVIGFAIPSFVGWYLAKKK